MFFLLLDVKKLILSIIIPSDGAKLLRQNHPHNCRTLDLADIENSDLSEIKQVRFYFEQKPNVDVEIVMEDSLKSVKRTNKFDKMANSGSRIELNLGSFVYSYFVAEFEQNVFLNDKATNECENYPTAKYLSYGHCDTEWVERVFKKDFPPGFLPVWATDDLNNVTTYFYGEFSELKEMSANNWYDDIISGGVVSNCTVPCTSTQIKTAFVDKKSSAVRKRSKIDITFSNNVKVSVTDFAKFNKWEFLSEIGGSLGLWLGLGVVQMLEFFAERLRNGL